MKGLWRSPWLWSLVFLLVACNQSTAVNQEEPSPNASSVNCPTTDESARQLDLKAVTYPLQAFDFTAEQISGDPNTVTVSTPQRQFVFCRATGQWSILPPSGSPQTTAAEPADLLGQSSTWHSLSVAEQTYQYRATLIPAPDPTYTNSPQKVIFELKAPTPSAAIALELYNVEQLRDSGLGYELGLPEVKAALTVGDALFFAIISEQGEGFSGLTTFVRYDLKTTKLELLQPPEIIGEQITDLIATTQGQEITFWFGTKYSAEGSPSIPAKGLMSYRFQSDAWQQGAIAVHSLHNSPLIGAVPTKLYQEAETLWAATGNGICQIQWQTIDNWDAWQCWRFALVTQLSASGLPLYRSLLSTVPATTLTPSGDRPTTEVLWWSSIVPFGIADQVPQKGRFEVVYPLGFQATIPEGAFQWDDQTDQARITDWNDQVYWIGEEWHWTGSVFQRGFDEVAANLVGLGAVGISEQGYNTEGIQDTNVLRGDLKLLSLTAEKTQIEYFSGWVDDQLIQPYVVVLPADKQPITTPSPIKAIADQL